MIDPNLILVMLTASAYAYVLFRRGWWGASLLLQGLALALAYIVVWGAP